MKKITKFLFLAVTAAALVSVVSCSKKKKPTFQESLGNALDSYSNELGNALDEAAKSYGDALDES